MGKAVSPRETIVAICAYAACSCSMLLINKLVLTYLKFPSCVAIIQFLFTLFILVILKAFGYQLDDLEWSKAKPFIIYSVGFAGGIYANMRVLAVSNVETVIVFRASTPIAVSLCDYLFLGREMPSRRSIFALGSILVGAIAYVMSDSQFSMEGWGAYSWACVYYGFLIFSMVYGKKLIQDIELKNKVMGSVWYTNIFSIPIMMGFALMKSEQRTFFSGIQNLEPMGIVFLLSSCLVGTGISYAGWWARDVCSATTYTLVGVLNKMGTITVNVLIWDNHASWQGLGALMFCLLGGTLYQQAPLRRPAYSELPTDEVGDSREGVQIKLVAVASHSSERGGVMSRRRSPPPRLKKDVEV